MKQGRVSRDDDEYSESDNDEDDDDTEEEEERDFDFRSPLWDPQGAERAAGPDPGGQDCFPDGGGVCGGQEQKLDKVKITLVVVLFQNLSQDLSVLFR